MSINEYVKSRFEKVPGVHYEAAHEADPYAYYKSKGDKYAKETVAYWDGEYKKYREPYDAYNASAKTFNEAIGHKTPAENKAIAERLLKKTQPKTVMA